MPGLSGDLAGARGDRASQAARLAPFLLDRLQGTAPKCAIWLGGLLRASYAGNILNVRRDSDDAELNIGAVATTGIVNLAAIASHCGAGNGYLVTAYDQSGNGNDVTQATAAKQHLIYDGSAPILGAKGFLAASFDPAKNAGYATPALGLSGSPDLTLLYDIAKNGASGPYMTTGLTESDRVTAVFLSDAWYDPNAESDSYTSVFGPSDSLATIPYPGFSYSSYSVQYALAAGAPISDVVARVNGGVVDATPGVGTDGVVVAGTSVLVWGADTWAPGEVLSGGVFLWNSLLSDHDQENLDAWMEHHHA